MPYDISCVYACDLQYARQTFPRYNSIPAFDFDAPNDPTTPFTPYADLRKMTITEKHVFCTWSSSDVDDLIRVAESLTLEAEIERAMVEMTIDVALSLGGFVASSLGPAEMPVALWL